MAFNTIEEAIAVIRRGGLVVVVDDEDRENEGDLIGAAELMSPKTLAFMIRWTSGVVCVGMTGRRLDQLGLPLMVARNSETMRTAFTVSVDLQAGTSTGISASDRAATVRALACPDAAAGDFNRPGHVFPLRANDAGVLGRQGHTEAAVDLARMAGLQPCGVLAEVVNADGSMARREDLKRFSKAHGLVMITVRDLVAHRRRTECIVEREALTRLPTSFGTFAIHGFRERHTGLEHVALTMGTVDDGQAALVRVHSECMTGEVFHSLRCDCKFQLVNAMRMIAAEGRGAIVYLRGHEGRGIGLIHKLRAYALQDDGLDTLEANRRLGLPVDKRDYSVGAQIIRTLGIAKLRLMTNNPRKYAGVSDFGLEIVERVPLLVEANPENAGYLAAKSRLMGHALPV